MEDRERTKSETVAAYQQFAEAYWAGTGTPQLAVSPDVAPFAAGLAPGAWVLEIGSGPGRDALALEEHGLRVRRTDITPAFVELLRAEGHEADVLDPLVDELGGPYDGVWASAVLVHLSRDEVPVVLSRLRAVTATGGPLHVSLKVGDGEAWSTHGHVAARRHFTYWRASELEEALAGAGWKVESLEQRAGLREEWMAVIAR